MTEWKAPAIYPRLGYEDELAAVEFLCRAFGFRERSESRIGTGAPDDPLLTWLEYGDGLVMIARAEHEVHMVHSPNETGGRATTMLNVAVDDIDAHYGRAMAEGARITMPINDAHGMRRYQARDPEGNHWHFSRSL